MAHAFLTYHQVALLALIPKHGAATAESLAQASTFPLRVVRDNLQGLVACGELLRDEAAGEYRHPEKHDA